MRWIINCTTILAAIAATALAAQQENPPRPPRSLTFIKNLVSTRLFGSEEPVAVLPNYRIFRVPGYDNILIKAVPKVPLAVESVVAEPQSVQVHPSISLVSSYLGTNSPNETLFALKGVKTLLQSGILETQENASVSYEPAQIPTAVVRVEPTKDVVYTRRVCTTCAYPSIQHVVPIPYTPVVEDLRKPVRVAVPNLLYPTKYSYKQTHHDGVTSYTSNDNKNVVITESQAPVRLPPYINNRFQEVLALGIHPVSVNAVPRMPVYVRQPPDFVPFYDVPVPVSAYEPFRVAPAPVPINYFYKHLHQDGSVSTHFGSGNVEENKGERANVYYSAYQPPAPLAPFIQDSDDPRVPLNPYLPIKVTADIAPTNYSYKHLHNDGTVLTFSGNGNVEECDGKKVTAPVHVSGTYQPTPFVPINDVPWIPVHPQLPMNVVPAPGPNDYSYKYVNNDKTVTQYSGSSMVQEGNQKPAIVVQGVSSPDPLPIFLANRIQNAAATALNYNYPPPAVVDKALYGPHIPVYQDSYPVLLQHLSGPGVKPFNPHFNDEVKVNFVGPQLSEHTVYPNVPSGYSYKTIHEDGTSTVNFDSSGLVQESIEKQKMDDVTNNFKGDYQGHYYNSASSSSSKTTDCITDTHVQNVAQQSVQSLENGNSNTSAFSYTAVHNDGSVTAYSDSTKVQENKVSGTAPRKVPTTTRKRLRKPTRLSLNNSTDVHRGSDELQNNSHSQTVTSQYSYKHIKHHNPNKLAAVQVDDTPNLNGQVNVQVEADDVAMVTSRPYTNTSPFNKKGEDSVSITPSDSVYVSTVPGSTLRPPLAVTTKPVSGFSYKHRHRVNTNKGTEVDYKTKTTSNYKGSEHTRAYHTTEAATSTSAISLSANPIVVLPDEQIFSYKQEKSDGSSVTVVGDNKNKVTVVEDNKSEGFSNRGDIPEEAY